MKRKKEIKEGKIIEEFKLGNTTVRINDAYITTDPAEVDKILERIADIVVNARMKSHEAINRQVEAK